MKNSKKLFSLILALIFVLTSVSALSYAADDSVSEVKNVILMIGDGMGENHLKWTKAAYDTDLFMDTIPFKGYAETDSLSGLTDSAAAGTALACGLHTYNSNLGTLSILLNGHGARFANFKNLCETAGSMGKKTGVLTSDDNSGATPSAFSSHVEKREMSEEITNQQLESGLDIIWACSNGRVNEENASSHGWTFCDSLEDIEELEPGEKSFASVDGHICYDHGDENDIPLSVLTELAINHLDCSEGFFLMIEGAHIDKYSHSNDAQGMQKSLLEFDKSVEEAVSFAEKDGNTLVLVTADHETGGIVLNDENGEYEFTATSHTHANVPLLVYGSSELVSDGSTVKNTEIARFIADRMGYDRMFPSVSLNAAFIPEFFKALFQYISDKIGKN